MWETASMFGEVCQPLSHQENINECQKGISWRCCIFVSYSIERALRPHSKLITSKSINNERCYGKISDGLDPRSADKICAVLPLAQSLSPLSSIMPVSLSSTYHSISCLLASYVCVCLSSTAVRDGTEERSNRSKSPRREKAHRVRQIEGG